MTHREFEGWDAYARRVAVAANARNPVWACPPHTKRVMQDEGRNSTSQAKPANTVISRPATNMVIARNATLCAFRSGAMPDALLDWCSGLERDLDPTAEMLHFLRQEIPNATDIDPWQCGGNHIDSTDSRVACVPSGWKIVRPRDTRRARV